jgi:hypothetical protein
MKPFRKHIAIAIDGGGIKGVMVAQAPPPVPSSRPASVRG